MTKSADAFRTISEVADWLGVQPHVLRFWESKFTQVKPVKRAGGRRYYRPNDMMLLGGIRKLLHDDGLTIKGVQKLMREEGMAYVAEMSPALDEQLGQVSFDSPPEPDLILTPRDPVQPDMFADTPPAAVPDSASESKEPAAEVVAFTAPKTPAPLEPQIADQTVAEAPMAEDVTPEPAELTHLPSFLKSEEAQAPMSDANAAATSDDTDSLGAEVPDDLEASLPHFSRADTHAAEISVPDTSGDTSDAQAAKPAQALPKIIDAPDPDETTLTAGPGALSAATHLRQISPAQRQIIAPLVARLAAHRDQLASGGASNRPV